LQKLGPVLQIPGLGSRKVVENCTIEGFLLVFNSNCRPTTHRLATIHERDQPTTNRPTTSRPFVVCASLYVIEAHKTITEPVL